MENEEEAEHVLISDEEDANHSSALDPAGYYAILGIPQKATMQEVRKAFLHFSQRYHPDKHSEQNDKMKDTMNDRFQMLQDAYSVLSDEKKRAAYDAAGLRGENHLSLVPKNVTSRRDIIDYIHSLEREAQIIRTAKMLSATSQITVNYSIAHLFLPSTPLIQSSEPHPESQSPTEAEEDAASTPSTDTLNPKDSDANTKVSGANLNSSKEGSNPNVTPANSKKGKAATTAASSPKDYVPGEEKETPGGLPNAGSVVTKKTEMSAVEVEINGERKVVLIPPAELQEKLRENIRAAQAGAQNGGGGESAQKGMIRRARRRPLTPGEAIAFAIVPKSLALQHSFQHAITPNLAFLFRTDARSEGNNASVSFSTHLEYQRDKIRTYGFTVRTAVTGLKSTYFYQRVLSPLWTMRQRWTLLSRGQILQKAEFILTRKLTSEMDLENTLAWSLYGPGYFKSRIAKSWDKGQQVLTAYFTYHGMTVSMYTVSSLFYGTDTKDPRHPPARGRVQYSINCNPLAGQTHVGFEAWYHHSVLQRFGLSFMSIIPYAFSPLAPPFFLVESSQFAVVNQISFLYARGQHQISIPVIVFISPRVSNALLWLCVPLTLYRLGRLLYRPYSNAKTARYYLQERKTHLAEMDIACQKAQLEQEALESAVLQMRAVEDRKNGLVIINAQYGVLEPEYQDPCQQQPSILEECGVRRRRPWLSSMVSRAATAVVRFFLMRGKKSSANGHFGSSESLDEMDPLGGDEIPLFIDVTVAVQNLVRESALMLPTGSKSKLVGFCDPDPFTPEKKQLKIVYYFNKKRHIAVYNDEEAVELPQRDHLVAQ